MAGYVRRFDVCLVPFIADEVTASMDLVKVYEYFAQGKPIVCTPVAEMVPYRRYLYLADGPDEFVAQLNLALAEDPTGDSAAMQGRITMARLNSWDERIDELESLILGALTGETRPAPASSASHSAASAELAKVRAELKAVRASLAKVNRTRAMRLMRRYWAARHRAGRAYRRLRPR
jgi:hypothetical protein